MTVNFEIGGIRFVQAMQNTSNTSRFKSAVRKAALIVLGATLWIVYVWLSIGIVLTLGPYFTDYGDNPFVWEKGEVGTTWWWNASLTVHVVTSVVCLFSVLLQFFRPVFKRAPWLHRWLGRVYTWSILAFVVPSGTVLAFFAKGGLLGAIGFLFTGFLAFAFTFYGWQTARQRRMREHAAWMIRSFAMISTAITFRLFHIALYIGGLSETTNYVISLWASTIFNLLAAELAVYFAFRPRKSAGENHRSVVAAKSAGRGQQKQKKKPKPNPESENHEKDPSDRVVVPCP